MAYISQLHIFCHVEGYDCIFSRACHFSFHLQASRAELWSTSELCNICRLDLKCPVTFYFLLLLISDVHGEEG